MVFMSPAGVEQLGQHLRRRVHPDALLDYQSICLMRKPEPGSPPRMGARFVEPPRAEPSIPMLRRDLGRLGRAARDARSYGIEASGPTEDGGWIALRNDRPRILAVACDELRLDNTTERSGGVGLALGLRFTARPGSPMVGSDCGEALAWRGRRRNSHGG